MSEEVKLESGSLILIEEFYNIVKNNHIPISGDKYLDFMSLGLLRKVATDARAAKILAELLVEEKEKIAPHSPIIVFSRSIVESAGLYAHWFLNNMDIDERNLEVAASFLFGERDRLKHVPLTSGYEKQADATKRLEQEILNDIKANPHWSSLSKKEQEKIEDKYIDFYKKGDLLSELGYGTRILPGLYSWMSDASHGGSRIILQLTESNPDTVRLVRGSLNFICYSLSILLFRLSEISPSIKGTVNNNEELVNVIDIYYSIATENTD